jgi:hypothetical protein
MQIDAQTFVRIRPKSRVGFHGATYAEVDVLSRLVRRWHGRHSICAAALRYVVIDGSSALRQPIAAGAFAQRFAGGRHPDRTDQSMSVLWRNLVFTLAFPEHTGPAATPFHYCILDESVDYRSAVAQRAVRSRATVEQAGDLACAARHQKLG